MRIINIGNQPRYCSYASKSGKTLQPGEQSQDVSFELIFNDVLWRDLKARNVQIRLSDADKGFVSMILAEDAKPVKISGPAPVKLSSREKSKLKAQQAELARQKAEAKAATTAKIPMNPGGATGQPVYGVTTKTSPIPIVMPGQPKSLEDLKRHNAGVAVKRAEVPANVPMNPRGGVPGQPVFSRGAGPGTENLGEGKAKADTLKDAASLLGSRV